MAAGLLLVHWRCYCTDKLMVIIAQPVLSPAAVITQPQRQSGHRYHCLYTSVCACVCKCDRVKTADNIHFLVKHFFWKKRNMNYMKLWFLLWYYF